MASVFLTLYVPISVVTSCQEQTTVIEASLKSDFRFPNLIYADYSVVPSFKKKNLI